MDILLLKHTSFYGTLYVKYSDGYFDYIIYVKHLTTDT